MIIKKKRKTNNGEKVKHMTSLSACNLFKMKLNLLQIVLKIRIHKESKRLLVPNFLV